MTESTSVLLLETSHDGVREVTEATEIDLARAGYIWVERMPPGAHKMALEWCERIVREEDGPCVVTGGNFDFADCEVKIEAASEKLGELAEALQEDAVEQDEDENAAPTEPPSAFSVPQCDEMSGDSRCVRALDHDDDCWFAPSGKKKASTYIRALVDEMVPPLRGSNSYEELERHDHKRMRAELEAIIRWLDREEGR